MNRRKERLAGMLLLGSALAVHAGCEDDIAPIDTAALGEGCLLDSDCDAPLVCVFRRCHYQCETTPDCHDTYGLDPSINCVLGDKPTNVCQLEDEIGCAIPAIDGAMGALASSRCPGEQICGVDGTCRDACGSDNDCVAGDVCVQGTCAHGSELNEAGLLTDPATKTPEGAPCSYTSECEAPLVCRDQTCGEACLQTVDCPEGKVCVLDEASQKHVCQSPTSPEEPLTCGNATKDADESDVDCGGSCLPCAPGSLCSAASDCTSSVCTGGVCASPSCGDGQKNGSETGEDCGGSCAACPPASPCDVPSDCTSGLCLQNVCYEAGCGNGFVDGDESDMDCGGSCPACEVGATCFEPGDCADGVCTAFSCAQGTCGDGIVNHGEKAIDCGGPCALGCGLGAPCDVASDCESGNCDPGALQCAPPSCSDGAQNGFETDVDCGGGCPPCGLGETCADDADCNGPTEGCDPALLQCAALHTVTVVRSGSGTGTVSSAPAGLIDCGAVCSVDLFEGTQLSLSAMPGASATFDGFFQGCAGPTCSLTITGDVTVEAVFSSPLIEWQRSLGNAATYPPAALAIDAAGNVLVGGAMGQTIDYGGGPLARISTSGGRDAWVAKYGEGGAHLWSFNYANGGATTAAFKTETIVTAGDGDPILLIEAGAPLQLAGALTVNCAAGGMALARLDAATGTVQAGACYGSGVAITEAQIEPDDDVVVVGTFTGSVDLGGGTLTASGTNAFVARYDGSTLAFEHGAVLGSPGGITEVRDLARSASGDYVVSGMCTGTVDLGGGVISANPQGNGTTGDVCFIKLSAALAPQWIYQRGVNSVDRGVSADFLPSGDVVGVGRFRALVDFGDGVSLNGSTADAIVMVHLAGGSGQLANPAAGQSVRMYASAGDDMHPGDLVIDPAGTIYLAGSAPGSSTLSFGGPQADTYVVAFSSFGVHAATRGSAEPYPNYETALTALRRAPSGALAVLGERSGNTSSPFGIASLPTDHGFLAQIVP